MQEGFRREDLPYMKQFIRGIVHDDRTRVRHPGWNLGPHERMETVRVCDCLGVDGESLDRIYE